MSLYTGLAARLVNEPADVVELSWEQMNRLVIGGLSPTSLLRPEWWSNVDEGPDSQGHAWLSAGFSVHEVSLPWGPVTFRRLP